MLKRTVWPTNFSLQIQIIDIFCINQFWFSTRWFGLSTDKGLTLKTSAFETLYSGLFTVINSVNYTKHVIPHQCKMKNHSLNLETYLYLWFQQVIFSSGLDGHQWSKEENEVKSWQLSKITGRKYNDWWNDHAQHTNRYLALLWHKLSDYTSICNQSSFNIFCFNLPYFTDIDRTFPDNIRFSTTQDDLRPALLNVLIAYAKHNPRIGYCQVSYLIKQ